VTLNKAPINASAAGGNSGGVAIKPGIFQWQVTINGNVSRQQRRLRRRWCGSPGWGVPGAEDQHLPNALSANAGKTGWNFTTPERSPAFKW
jgi:hypothetical protein